MNKIASATLAAGLLLSAAQGFAGSGASQSDPFLPNNGSWTYTAPDGRSVTQYYFFDVKPNLWFSAPAADGFDVWIGNAVYFTGITAPIGATGWQLLVNQQVVDASFNAGESYSFAANVTHFEIRNMANSGLPLKLAFATSASSMFANMTWVASPSAVPEADIYMMLIGGLAALGLMKRRGR